MTITSKTDLAQVQTDFSAGDISPSARGRIDSDFYQSGLSKCDKMLVNPQGSLRRRNGFKFMGQTHENRVARLINFNRGVSRDVVLEFTRDHLRMWRRDGLITDGEQITDYVQNGNFSQAADGLAFWNVTYALYGLAAVDPVEVGVFVSNQVMYVSNVVYGINGTSIYSRRDAFIQQVIVIKASDRGNLLEISFTLYDKGDLDPNDDLISTFSAIVSMGTNGGNSDIIAETTYTTPGPKTIQFTPPAGLTDLNTFLNIGATPAQISGPDFTTVLSYYAAFYDIKMPKPAVDTGTVVVLLHGLTIVEIATMQYVSDTSGDSIYFASNTMVPKQLSQETGAWVFGDFNFQGSAPAEWEAGNYPATIDIFQSRLWFASAPLHPSYIWGSKPGVLHAFNDPISLVLAVATRGIIQWIKGTQGVMHVGTDVGEHVITSQGAALSINDIAVSQNSAYGSTLVQPGDIGTQLIYISGDGRTIRALQYSRDQNNWVSVDLSVLANHLTNAGVTSIVDSRNPFDQIVYNVPGTGWLQHTFNTDLQVSAFHSHNIPGASVGSMTSSAESGGSVIWATVQRGGNTYIEKQIPTPTEDVFLDGHVYGSVVSDGISSWMEGLDHINGYVASAIINNEVIIEGVVINGILLLPDGTLENAPCLAGTSFISTIGTLPRDPGALFETFAGAVRRHSLVYVGLANSRPPIVNGNRYVIKNPLDEGVNGQSITGTIEMTSLGWSKGSRNQVSQDKPYPLNILNIASKYHVRRK